MLETVDKAILSNIPDPETPKKWEKKEEEKEEEAVPEKPLKKFNIIYMWKFIHWIKNKQVTGKQSPSKSVEIRIKTVEESFKDNTDFCIHLKGRSYELMGW